MERLVESRGQSQILRDDAVDLLLDFLFLGRLLRRDPFERGDVRASFGGHMRDVRARERDEDHQDGDPKPERLGLEQPVTEAGHHRAIVPAGCDPVPNPRD